MTALQETVRPLSPLRATAVPVTCAGMAYGVDEPVVPVVELPNSLVAFTRMV